MISGDEIVHPVARTSPELGLNNRFGISCVLLPFAAGLQDLVQQES